MFILILNVLVCVLLCVLFILFRFIYLFFFFFSLKKQMANADRAWLSEKDCLVNEFANLIDSKHSRLEDHPFACRIEANIPVYECADILPLLRRTSTRAKVMSEWLRVFSSGAGVIVLKHAFAEDVAAIDKATAVFEEIIEDEKRSRTSAFDHFAKPGANDRLWNSHEKLCLRAPDVFVEYTKNELIVAVAESWLGPQFQMTAQVNVVKPGGNAQNPHRDYHLGFCDSQAACQFPAHVHLMSQRLTLQGGIAHCDMPVESGPTKFLPFSQLYVPGYVAFHQPEFQSFCNDRFVQIALEKGDAIFFNPALFHAGAQNRTCHINRMINLLQISSAFGRAMETLDRTTMCQSVFPHLVTGVHSGGLSRAEKSAVIACCAEGYSFPTNLDLDVAVGSLAPLTQANLMTQAVDERWLPEKFSSELCSMAKRHLSSKL